MHRVRFFIVMALVGIADSAVRGQEATVVAENAPAVDTAQRVLHATVKIFNPRSTATGFLVRLPDGVATQPRECALVTAQHVLEQVQGETAILVLRKRDADGGYARRDTTVSVRTKENPLWSRHPKQDVAVMKFVLPEDAANEPLPYETLAGDAELAKSPVPVGGRLLAMGFPTRFETHGAGFPVTRQGVLSSFPLVPSAKHPTFFIDVTAFAGDSGGPVFVAPREPSTDSPTLIGLVTGQVRNDERMQSLTEERVVHHPLGIAVVVHSSIIREVLETFRTPSP
ncbi:MAG: serine protease [Pirellulales bacterium]